MVEDEQGRQARGSDAEIVYSGPGQSPTTRAEMIAIVEGLNACSGPVDVVVHTDSKPCITRIQVAGEETWYADRDLQIDLLRVLEDNSISSVQAEFIDQNENPPEQYLECHQNAVDVRIEVWRAIQERKQQA